MGNWSDDDTLDIIELAFPDSEGVGTTVGDFEAECPCCGQLMTFRLNCTAVAQETETER